MGKPKKRVTRKRSPRQRDDFPIAVLRHLAGEVGHLCSNPTCLAPTAGPSRSRGVSNTGGGAHITAAARKGPRFDRELLSAERSSANHRLPGPPSLWLRSDDAGRDSRGIERAEVMEQR
jgi:hypothetical protein